MVDLSISIPHALSLFCRLLRGDRPEIGQTELASTFANGRRSFEPLQHFDCDYQHSRSKFALSLVAMYGHGSGFSAWPDPSNP